MCEHKEESVIERLSRERDEARKDALVANRALRSLVLQDTKIEEIEGKITVDQTQEIGQEFARLMFGMLMSAGAANCLEWIVEHPDEGRFTLTLQRCNGKSPMDLRNDERDRADRHEQLLRYATGYGGISSDEWVSGMDELIKKWKESDANANGCDPWGPDRETAHDQVGQVAEAAVRPEVSSVGGPCSPVCSGSGGGSSAS